MKNSILSILCIISLAAVMQSCSKEASDNTTASISDQSIARMANSGDMVSINSSDKTIQTMGGSFRIKMNSVAVKAYKNGTSNYPNNSILVREALDANGNVTGSDIMFRSENDAHAHNGWIWTSLDGSGNVIYDGSLKGVKCQSCHSGSVSTLAGL